jgi:hypothetical protein
MMVAMMMAMAMAMIGFFYYFEHTRNCQWKGEGKTPCPRLWHFV